MTVQPEFHKRGLCKLLKTEKQGLISVFTQKISPCRILKSQISAQGFHEAPQKLPEHILFVKHDL